MSQIMWKGFTLDSLFEFDSSGQLSLNKKGLDFVEEADTEHTVALITQSEKNNGISGYLKDAGEVSNKKKHHAITYSMHFGLCYYHSYDFVLMDTHGSVFVLNAKNNILKNILDCNEIVDHFVSEVITYECTNEVYSYSYLPNSSRSGREIILLPCLEVSSGQDFIWEDNGKYYTLAVDYIEKLMDAAKEEKEKKTIKLYKAEREKYEAEREKYEEGYTKEKPNVVWKEFTLGYLFDRNSSHQIKAQKKELDESEQYDEEHTIRNITASKENNGCSGYLADTGEVSIRKKINMLTVASDAAYGGICFYQDDWFVTTGHNDILEVKNSKLKEIIDACDVCYHFLARLVSKVLMISGVNRFNRSISGDFDREIILLPCLEVSSGQDFIWEDNGKHYNLAVNYIAYIYLTGKINYNNKLIDSYSYLY